MQRDEVLKHHRYTAEPIIGTRREAEVALAQGESVPTVARRLGVAEPTDDRWRREYGGLRVDQAKRLKELERENSRRKRLVADQALDNAMLRVVIAVDVDRDLAGEAETELLHRRAVGEAEDRLLVLGDDHHLVAVRLQPGATPGITPGPLVERGDAFQDLAVVDALDGGHVVPARWSDRDRLCHARATLPCARCRPTSRDPTAPARCIAQPARSGAWWTAQGSIPTLP